MKAPAISKWKTNTYRRAYRARAPFVTANKLDLIRAKEQGCACGYKGVAITFLTPPGQRGPSSVLLCSRATFIKAMVASELVCYNCAFERRERKKVEATRRVVIHNTSTSMLQQALAQEAGSHKDANIAQ